MPTARGNSGGSAANVYPDKDTNSTLNFPGAQHPLSSPLRFNGGEWYVKAGFDYYAKFDYRF